MGLVLIALVGSGFLRLKDPRLQRDRLFGVRSAGSVALGNCSGDNRECNACGDRIRISGGFRNDTLGGFFISRPLPQPPVLPRSPGAISARRTAPSSAPRFRRRSANHPPRRRNAPVHRPCKAHGTAPWPLPLAPSTPCRRTRPAQSPARGRALRDESTDIRSMPTVSNVSTRPWILEYAGTRQFNYAHTRCRTQARAQTRIPGLEHSAFGNQQAFQ